MLGWSVCRVSSLFTKCPSPIMLDPKKKVSLTAANIGLQQLTGAKTLAFTDRKVHDILKMSPQYRYHQREVSFADLFTYIGLYPSNIAT